jgi:hypothetical protein
MLWDLLMLFVGLGLAAVGLVNPGASPVWFGLAFVCLVAMCVRELRARQNRVSVVLPDQAVPRGQADPDVPAAGSEAHPLNDFIDARNDGRKLRGQLTRPWDETSQRDFQTLVNRCRGLGRKWPEHRDAIDRAIDRALPTPVQQTAAPVANEEMMDARRASAIGRVQTILEALDRIIKGPIDNAEFVRGCTTYIAIGEQKSVRVRAQPLETTDAEWATLDEDVHAYLNEVLLFLNEHRPKYWQRLSDRLSELTQEKVTTPIRAVDANGNGTGTFTWGHGIALGERIDRVVQTLRVVVDES